MKIMLKLRRKVTDTRLTLFFSRVPRVTVIHRYVRRFYRGWALKGVSTQKTIITAEKARLNSLFQ